MKNKNSPQGFLSDHQAEFVLQIHVTAKPLKTIHFSWPQGTQSGNWTTWLRQV